MYKSNNSNDNNEDDLNWSRSSVSHKKDKKYRHPRSQRLNDQKDNSEYKPRYKYNKNYKNNKYNKNNYIPKKNKEQETYDIKDTCEIDNNIYKMDIRNDHVSWIDLLHKSS
tara:strand:+ start:20 stop:352 length:333 start_codon:yes stop_codon:yes gene_type:complete